MAFNLRSGNKARFKSLGSSSRSIMPNRTKSSPFVSKKQDEKNEKEWNKQTSTASDWLRQDLESPGYKKRLQKELEAAGEEDYIKTTPKEGDKYYSKVSNEKEILEARRDRAKKTKYHVPGEIEEGRSWDTMSAQAIADHVENKALKEGSDIYYSPHRDWQGVDADRVTDLTIHEGAHSITAGEHGMLKNTKNLLTNAKGGDASKGNINRPQEVYARYKVAQKWAQDQGIFDAFSGKEFTDKNYNKVMKELEGVTEDNYQEKGIPYEVITFFGDGKQWEGHGFNKKMSKKHVKQIFNEVATNEPDPSQITDDFGQNQFA